VTRKAPARRGRPLAAVVLAAGKGTRLPADAPKVLVECLGLPLLEHVRRAVDAQRPDEVAVVVGHRREAVTAWLAEHWKGARAVVQEPQQGTGHALRLALEALSGFEGDVLVVHGDVPQMTAADLEGLVAAHRASDAKATVLVGRTDDPGHLGRVVRGADGRLARIVETKHATEDERRIPEFNTGLYVFDAATLRPALEGLAAHGASREEYLTDAVATLASAGRVETVAAKDGVALAGVNTALDLARASDLLRRRLVAEHLERGAQIVDPETTWIEPDVEIEAGARVLPFVYLGRGCRLEAGSVVGPFAHLRGGTVLRRGAQVGNFVEVKASTLGEGAKAKHLAYLGDADVGARANIGCGTITANYDGVRKHRTSVGADARIGSGTVLVAPVSVGDGAVTGANATVLAGRDVPAGATAVGVPARVLAGGGGKARAKARGKGRAR
jgi:bifunctional UDP-N-acetylglucosamine pyrophosphorylase/glucosamine-1-phosphate N-acetyltransferase